MDAIRSSTHASRQRELILLCRQLGTMLNAGTDILRALLIVRDQVSHPLLQSALETARNDMTLGCTLAVSLGRYPNVFTPFFVDMVRQGEAEGMLGEVLQNLADYLEKELRVDIDIAVPRAASPVAAPMFQPFAAPAASMAAWFRLAVWMGCALVLGGITMDQRSFPLMLFVGMGAAGWGLVEMRRARKERLESPAVATSGSGRPVRSKQHAGDLMPGTSAAEDAETGLPPAEERTGGAEERRLSPYPPHPSGERQRPVGSPPASPTRPEIRPPVKGDRRQMPL
jgi:hypothetical protein